jgi:hypothetical protein
MVKIAETSLIKKTVAAVVLVAALAAAAGAAQAKPFHKHGHHGWRGPVGAGLALGLVGAAIAASTVSAYADDDVVCGREARFDEWGNYIGRVRVCRPAY